MNNYCRCHISPIVRLHRKCMRGHTHTHTHAHAHAHVHAHAHTHTRTHTHTDSFRRTSKRIHVTMHGLYIHCRKCYTACKHRNSFIHVCVHNTFNFMHTSQAWVPLVIGVDFGGARAYAPEKSANAHAFISFYYISPKNLCLLPQY